MTRGVVAADGFKARPEGLVPVPAGSKRGSSVRRRRLSQRFTWLSPAEFIGWANRASPNVRITTIAAVDVPLFEAFHSPDRCIRVAR